MYKFIPLFVSGAAALFSSSFIVASRLLRKRYGSSFKSLYDDNTDVLIF